MTSGQITISKAILHILCWFPLLFITWQVITDQAGANPIEYATRESGTWTLQFLLITLTVSPLARFFSWPVLIRYRRMLGLYAFTYSIIHWLTYLWLDQFFDWNEIIADVIKRPFIFAGTIAFLLLIPLAVTSNRRSVIRLGGLVWRRIHRLVYAAVVAGILHYWLQVRADFLPVSVYTAILGGLFLWRIVYSYQSRKERTARAS